MSYSRGVRLTGSPSRVTAFAASSNATPPMVMAVGLASPPPSCIYRRSWERTRASSSTGLKGLVT